MRQTFLDIKTLTNFRIDKKNFLTDQEYNLIVEIELLFHDKEFANDNLFTEQFNILEDLLVKTFDIYHEKNTTFIVDNLRIANYYKKPLNSD